jgi:hypothetical protein
VFALVRFPKDGVMASGTLANLAHSAFVRTPRPLGSRVVHHLLRWPTASTVLDPTAGEGDLLYPTLSIPGTRRFGIEISAERAGVARDIFGNNAHIFTAAFEAVHVPRRSMSVVLANPPYFFTNGKRAEYIIISRAGESLLPGGIMVAILPARSAWDALMINHWASWYSHIRVWKFPDRISPDDEGAFEDFTQICVGGVRRAEPVEVDPAERKRLQGYRWRVPRTKTEEEGGWEYGTPPPDLPTEPIDDPYQVPFCRDIPELAVRRADEATLLEALAQSGAHRSAEWDNATYWPEEASTDLPSMPLTGPAHLAAAILNDAVGGQTITGPEEGPNEQHCLFTAFIGSQWIKLPIGSEEREKMRENGVVRASARQWQDQPVLGVMNLDTGEARYYEGSAALAFLEPWLKRLAERVTRLRPPLYLLDPADWELRLFTQFATDKRLPGASFPGLAPAQIHRICAMGRSLDATGRTAIQGEPGTGKTRMGTGSAARQAYRWRYRNTEFSGQKHPAWMKKLRRAWLKNPRTLAMLGLAPVYGVRLPATSQGAPQIREDPASRQIVAYREIRTGHLVLPEDAGPRALPVLVTTPKKVTKEYGREIRAAWPEAEIMGIDSYQDIPRFMQRCAESSAPAVVGIFSHSTTRAFGCEWVPAVQERIRTRQIPNLDPPDREQLEAVYNRRGDLQGYRVPGTDQLITEERKQKRYLCPDCFREIEAVPGAQMAREDPSANLAAQFKEDGAWKEAEEGEKQTVTSRVYFEKKQRWCRCQDRRNQERAKRGAKPRQNALWMRSWRQDLREKYPPLSVAEWQRAMERLRQQARQEAERATSGERVALLATDHSLQAHLVDAALADEATQARVVALVRTYTPPAGCPDLATPHGLRQALLRLVQRHQVMREKLVHEAEHLLDWTPAFFQAAMQCWQAATPLGAARNSKKPTATWHGVRLQATPGRKTTGQPGQIEQAYSFHGAVPGSFSPYDYLYRFFRGCVALAIVDESHNGRGASTDIAHAHHLAMLAAQTRELTSGTHYGGDILSFYHYWFRFNPGFWKGLGLGWKDAAKALKLFGVVQEWTREYESDARKGSGATDVRVSTIPAPGLSSKLIPRLLTDLNYLTVLDVGAFMPPRIEIPELVNMRDPAVREAQEEARAIRSRVKAEQEALQRERLSFLHRLEKDESVRPEMAAFTARAEAIAARHEAELALAEERQAWADERDLEGEHADIVSRLEKLSQHRNQTARMGKGTIPRWFAALPCDAPFTLEQTRRGTWGEELGKTLLLTTRSLCWDYLYPAEVRLREIVLKELAEGRRVMVYIEQNELRSMSKRLAWVFKDLATWTLPGSVKSEDRQQAILDAVQKRGIRLIFVPYRKVNEGLNLQSAIDTIVWYEMAMNLFLLDQASRRAWRLGKQEEVRIYYIVYAGTSGHSKLRKLGNQSGAAAAFAGEPARGALIEHAGADKTTLARLAAFVDAQQSMTDAEDEDEEEEDLFSLNYSEEEAQQLKAAFARRAEEEREALKKGRQWLGGVVDTLPKRLPAFFAQKHRFSVWKEQPKRRFVFTPDTVNTMDAAVLRGPEIEVQMAPMPVEIPGNEAKVPRIAASPETKEKQTRRTGNAKLTQAVQPKSGKAKGRKDAAAGALGKLIFGNEEHIALVRRPKRARKPASLKHPKRTSPVDVRTITAVDEAAIIEATPQAIALSLWEVFEDMPMGAWSSIAPPAEHPEEEAVEQLHLW